MVFQLGFRGRVAWPRVAERVLGVVGTKGWVCLGAAEKISLAGQWVWEDWSVKVCWGQMGASRDLGPAPRFPSLAYTGSSGC